MGGLQDGVGGALYRDLVQHDTILRDAHITACVAHAQYDTARRAYTGTYDTADLVSGQVTGPYGNDYG